MSEWLSVVGGAGHESELPNDLNMEYEQLNFKLDKNGRPLWYGEYDATNRRLKAGLVLRAFGHDPAEKFDPQPAAAIWTVKGQETPVIVNGFHGVEDEVTYYKIKGSNTGVPLSQLKWLKPIDETDLQSENEAGPTIESLNGRVEELQMVVDEFKTTLEGMHAELQELKTEKAKLETKNEELRRRNDQLEAVLWQNGIEVPKAGSSPEESADTAVVSSEPVRIASGLDETEEPAEGGRQATEQTTRSSWRDRAQTARDWFSLRRPVTYIQTRRMPSGDVEETVITEERTNPAAVVAGFIGAAILGGIIGYELKHTGHSNAKELHTIINQNNHLKTEVHNMHKAINHDSTVIGQNHQILKNNQAQLKQLHEQVHHLYKLEKAEGVHGQSGVVGSEARLSYSGDTVWHETARRLREKLGYSASAAKIHKATAYVLRLNGWRWSGGGAGVDAHKLPIGTPIKMPSNIVEIVSQ